MNTNTNPLAVMERDAVQAVQWRVSQGENVLTLATESDEARAAVAELVEAANEGLAMLDTFNVEYGMFPEQIAHLSALRAALAAFEVK